MANVNAVIETAKEAATQVMPQVNEFAKQLVRTQTLPHRVPGKAGEVMKNSTMSFYRVRGRCECASEKIAGFIVDTTDKTKQHHYKCAPCIWTARERGDCVTYFHKGFGTNLVV